ncbi:MAG: deoxycytidylate deaminase [Bacillota bacterium]
MKRSDYISWDAYFMGVAELSSMRSKDPSTQVGAVIVNRKNRIVGIGYNGFPIGIDDDVYPWENEGEFLNTKYPYVVHAEPNAILNSTVSLENTTLYVTLFPCHECAKLIIQSGIKEIVYAENKYQEEASFKASKRMLEDAGVNLRQIQEIEVTLNHV